jgi:hypothetical protein
MRGALEFELRASELALLQGFARIPTIAIFIAVSVRRKAQLI